MPNQGPNFPTTTTGNTNAIGGGSVTWSNPGNIGASDGSFATATGSNLNTDDLIGTGFGFSITTNATINGILLQVNYQAALSINTVEGFVKLIKAGSAVGSNKSTFAFLPTTATTIDYGSSTDLWGTTWTAAEINASNFGAITSYGLGTSADTISVDFFRVTITYTLAGITTSVSALFGF